MLPLCVLKLTPSKDVVLRQEKQLSLIPQPPPPAPLSKIGDIAWSIKMKNMKKLKRQQYIDHFNDTMWPYSGFGYAYKEASFVDLPELAILAVLKHLPIKTQNDLCSPNPHLSTLMYRSFRQIKALTLVNSSDNEEVDPIKLIWNTECKLAKKLLDFNQFLEKVGLSTVSLPQNPTEAHIQNIQETFPAVTDVTLALHRITVADARLITTYLIHMANNLISLKLNIELVALTGTDHRVLAREELEQAQVLSALLNTVNEMPELKHLTVFLGPNLKRILTNGTGVIPTINLPILHQLETVNLVYNDHPIDLWPTFRQHANANLIARISTASQLQIPLRVAKFPEQMLRSLKHHHITIRIPIPSNFFTKYYPYLTSLHIHAIGTETSNFITYRDILEALVNLKHLYKLSIRPEFAHDTTVYPFLYDDEETPVERFPVLRSIKRFTFHVYYLDHFDINARLHIEHCFPNLDTFLLDVKYCLEIMDFFKCPSPFKKRKEAKKHYMGSPKGICGERWMEQLNGLTRVPTKTLVIDKFSKEKCY